MPDQNQEQTGLPRQGIVELTVEEQREGAIRQLDEAYLDGRSVVIREAHENIRRINESILGLSVDEQQRSQEPVVTVLRPTTRNHRVKEFTGAPRRIAVRGGAFDSAGGSHRDQKLYR